MAQQLEQLKGSHLVSLDEWSAEQILHLLRLAEWMRTHRDDASQLAAGSVMATLFYQPSTRTRLSFETAMLRLGGHVAEYEGRSLDTDDLVFRETIHDLIRSLSQIDDIIVIRHPGEGSALVAARASDVPVINAGDGGHLHPTQTLADLATLLRLKGGKLRNLTIGLCGNLAASRTAHSLVTTLCRLGHNLHFVLVSTRQNRMPDWVLARLDRTPGFSYEEVDSLRPVISSLDVLYMTSFYPTQVEPAGQARQASNSTANGKRLSRDYRVTPELLRAAKPDLAILHPLPRGLEIDRAVDDDPRAAYFTQISLGVDVRMALIATLLGKLPQQFDESVVFAEQGSDVDE